MKQAVNLKIKLTKRSLTTLLLLKLRSSNMGTNEAEEYAAHDIAKGRGDKRGRKRNIRSLMKQKIAMAKANEVKARKEYRKKMDYVEKRWGDYKTVMQSFKGVMQKEVRRVCNEGRIKLKAKIEHLSKKWNKGVKHDKRKQNQENGKSGQHSELEGTWRGIRYGDQALRKKAEEENREINVNKEPIIYGKVETTEGENEILKLAPNFTTYKAVSAQDMETAAEVMNAKIKMELRARKEREQKHGEWR